MNRNLTVLIWGRGVAFRQNGLLTYYDSDGRYIDLIAELFKEVILYVPIVENEKDNKHYKYAKRYKYRFSSVNVNVVSRPKTYIKIYKSLNLFKNRVDLYYSMGPSYGSYLTTLLFNRSKVIIYNGIDFNCENLICNRFKKIVEKIVLKRADYVLCTGAYLKSNYEKRYNIEYVEETIPFISLSTNVINEYDRIIPRRNKNGLHVLSIGHFTERKQQIVLVRAVHHLYMQGVKDIYLHLIGDGKKDDFIKINSGILSELSDRTIFYGSISDPNKLDSIFNKCDILCITSLEEGVPRVSYEAMIKGLCVVSTPLPGLLAKFSNESVIYFSFNNYLELSEKIMEIYNCPDYYISMRRNNMNRMKDLFSQTPEKQLSNILEILF